MATIIRDTDTDIPKRYVTKRASYKIIARGTGGYIVRCPHSDCKAEISLETLDRYVGLTSGGESCPFCGKEI